MLFRSVQWLPLWADQLAGAANPYAKAYTQLASSFGAVTACLIGAWACNLVGRRLTYCLLSLGSLTGLVLVVVAVQQASQLGLSLSQLVRAMPLLVPSILPIAIPATTLFAAFAVFTAAAAWLRFSRPANP